MTVYISGPISCIEDMNRKAFSEAEQKLNAMGHRGVNPHEICSTMDPSSTWEQYMREDLKALLRCDAFTMLDGWKDSCGASLENLVAQTLGMPEIKI